MTDPGQLILATGAYEFVPPFPGWTSPGVLTPGAVQLMIKSMHVAPGQRVLLCGTGPFLLVVATALLDANVEVVGIVESVRRVEAIKSLPGLFPNVSMLRQGWQYLRQLRRRGVPIHTGHVILDAEGDGQVQRVCFAPCDHEWRPQRGKVNHTSWNVRGGPSAKTSNGIAKAKTASLIPSIRETSWRRQRNIGSAGDLLEIKCSRRIIGVSVDRKWSKSVWHWEC